MTARRADAPDPPAPRPTRDVAVPLADGGELPAALALPAPDPAARAAGVLVLHEALGLDREMRRIAGTFAGAGYVALAPDFLAGLGPMPFCLARFARGLGRAGAGRPYRQLDAARAWLAARPEVDGDRIGVAGFCIGGGFAMLWAADRGRSAVRVAAPFYGPVPENATERLAGICPTVASYGGRDRFFRTMPERLEQALTTLGVEHDVTVYPDAGHSFMNRIDGPLGAVGRRLPMRAGYHEPSAREAWARVLAFFDRHLGGATPE
jgi:carboxymethylenebutenolidase